MSAEVADVVVIGAGASGAVVSLRLAQAGWNVVCLEQGRWTTEGDSPSTDLEREVRTEWDWNYDPNVRGWEEDYPCEVSESEVRPLMFNAVGGGTVHFGGDWYRLIPSDFCSRTLDGVGDDWPISYEDLAPYYDRIDRHIGASGLAGNTGYPEGFSPPLEAMPIGSVGRRAAEGMNARGWHWWPASLAIASAPYGRLGACARRGTCSTGCPEGAKAAFDHAVWPDAVAAGAKLITGARVSGITTDSRGRATGCTWIDRDGAEHRQDASAVVVGANGIGTPRLLLMSASPAHPDGLANSSGLVGRRLMMHPYGVVTGVYEDQLSSWFGPYGYAVSSFEFLEGDSSRGFPRGAKLQALPIIGPIDILKRLQGAGASVAERTGAAGYRHMQGMLGHAFDWSVTAEDLPDEQNTVSLDDRLTDSDGLPSPRIRYRIPATAAAAVAWTLERGVEAHLAAGATETYVLDQSGAGSGWHLLGTARMGDDPSTSVVDNYGRSHDVDNLFIVDGSVFVTSGATNPTSTIAALALRTAEHMINSAG